jgi:5'-methylthioadenosine phosphorylase
VIGIFGGSGFYDFLDDAVDHDVATPYGPPAAPVTVGTVAGRDVAFLPRHGRSHEYPAHRVPYRANVWAMQEVGVDRLLGPSAVGSLRTDVAPGDFVVCDQLVDRTSGRERTFFDGPETVHVSFADPYCAEMRPVLVQAASESGATVRDRGTVVVINGPGFSTRAESRFYSGQGWDLVNMSQFPEAFLARELELCYATVCVVTDYDVGVEGDIPPVTHGEVLRRFAASIETLRDALGRAIPKVAATPRQCECPTARETATG